MFLLYNYFMKKNILKLKDNEGNIKEYEVILMFKNNNKDYIVYTDNKNNNDGSINVYANIFNPNDLSVFENIETNEEWEEIERRLELLGGINNELDN